jgi:hypothetical protein
MITILHRNIFSCLRITKLTLLIRNENSHLTSKINLVKRLKSVVGFLVLFSHILNRGNGKKIKKLDTVKLGASLSCYEAEFFPPVGSEFRQIPSVKLLQNIWSPTGLNTPQPPPSYSLSVYLVL